MAFDEKPSGQVDFTERSQYLSVDKQLLQYFKKSASGIIFPMLVGFLPISFCKRIWKVTITFSIFAFLSLLLNTIPLLFAGKVREKKDRGPNEQNVDEELVEEYNKRCIRWLCVAAFASNFVLMVTAVCLMSVLNITYFYYACAVVLLIGIPYGYHVEHSLRNEVEWGVVQYKEYQDDLKYFFDLSSEVTQAAFLGLPATLFSQLRSTNCSQSLQVRVPEVLTMYTVLFGLFIMLMCTVPLGSEFDRSKEKFVKVFIRFSTYALLVFLAVVAFLAAIEIIEALVVLAFVFVLGACIGGQFWKVCCRTPRSSISESEERNERDMASLRSHSMASFGFCPAMFGVLMASYSRSRSVSSGGGGGGGAGISKLYKTCIFFMFVALISNLTRMLLVHEVHDDDDSEGEPPLLLVSGLVNVFLMLLTVILVILIALLQPQQIQSTFVLA
ncbi:hypothetical protein OsI_35783 [Oryza sativa Indica Group]|uniref:Uncharacterized protein n=1 Tax=Oryza sativa subsp. indica TaxID=39946 RepID=B8BK13_ORYSI|nr:hypothetical protein OsI_35783 [Oryza sativa Indica Group]